MWQRLHGPAAEGRSLAQTIDRKFQAARIARGGVQVTFKVNVAGLPRGTQHTSVVDSPASCFFSIPAI
ncbi:hypothetical protein CLV79_11555 [Limimaricola soesokkakensis]|uniref:Uncharacterized protein n=1 Tax=Limimaricola soesokkakensis TaxID=1343159 RepID=A0A1X7A0Y2_9RHOB|nr:hypothetical protein CLV79_11555 [Limimaricola soesokkakensis]SLN67549.1 hypothetical protein LOS8367_03378 [Limimaricola soesokkakensis]